MSPSTVEWSLPTTGVCLRQGDIIRTERNTPQELSDLWMILTSDCDLARAKHYGRLTCVPVMTMRRYLELFIFPSDVEMRSFE